MQKIKMMDIIVTEMQNDKHIGIVFPDDPHCPGWDANYNIARIIAKKLGIDELPKEFNFPIGTMFWARKGSLSPLFDLGIKWNEYPNEPIGNDGTILHAIERLIPIIAMKQGYGQKQTHVRGVNR